MKARVKAIEKFAKCGADFTRAKTGEMCGLLLEFETPCEQCGKPTYDRFCSNTCVNIWYSSPMEEARSSNLRK